MKTVTLILFAIIAALPLLSITACAPSRVNYGVSIRADSHWGHHHNYRRYHHRPSYRHHARPHHRR